jgi:hypothetical protein
VSNVPPPPGGYPQQPQQPQYQPPQPQYQQPQPQYQQPQQFQPVNPAAAKSGNGCLKAFLIVMAISVVLGVVGTVALIAFGTKVVNDNFGEAKTSDYAIDIPAGNCTLSSSGLASVDGTLTNKSDTKHVFRLTVDFVGTDGTKIDTSPFVLTPSLSPGEKGSWTATAFTSSTKGTDINCNVSKVEYFGT